MLPLIMNLSGCTQNITISNTNTGKLVSFIVQIDKKGFSNKRDLEARLFNSEQIKQSEQQANCSISFDATTGKETTSCPPGVTYKPVTPETFKFKIDDIKENISFKSASVKTGEKFRLMLSGLSTDNCNTASASVEKTADSENMNITGLLWAQTELGCQP